MWCTQTPVSTKKCGPRGIGALRPARIRWYFVQALQWNQYDLAKATAALRRSGYDVTPHDVLEVLRVSCRPRQIEPIEFAGGLLEIAPGRNPLRLRMAAAGTLLELARRGHG
jgi:hypothetical protein